MGFEKFGLVSFTSETKVAEFIGFLEKGRMMATKCSKCGRNFFPPRADCGSCTASQMEWVEITGQGKLVACSTIMYGPTGFEDTVPYTLAVARFSNRIQVLGSITRDVPADRINVGMKVKIHPIRMSEERLSYEFIPDDNL